MHCVIHYSQDYNFKALFAIVMNYIDVKIQGVSKVYKQSYNFSYVIERMIKQTSSKDLSECVKIRVATFSKYGFHTFKCNHMQFYF